MIKMISIQLQNGDKPLRSSGIMKTNKLQKYLHIAELCTYIESHVYIISLFLNMCQIPERFL